MYLAGTRRRCSDPCGQKVSVGYFPSGPPTDLPFLYDLSSRHALLRRCYMGPHGSA
jgi:hypothetical protein